MDSAASTDGVFIPARLTKQPRELGCLGERAARDYFLQQGYLIIKENYRARRGEVDLIVRDPRPPGTICFVEVKTRTRTTFGRPEEAVSRWKQARLIRAAEQYVVEKDIHDSHLRFDVVSCVPEQSGFRLFHFPDAFTMDEGVG